MFGSQNWGWRVSCMAMLGANQYGDDNRPATADWSGFWPRMTKLKGACLKPL